MNPELGADYQLLAAVANVVQVLAWIAILVAMVGTWLVFKITEGVAQRYQETGFRWGQIGTASLVSSAAVAPSTR